MKRSSRNEEEQEDRDMNSDSDQEEERVVKRKVCGAGCTSHTVGCNDQPWETAITTNNLDIMRKCMKGSGDPASHPLRPDNSEHFHDSCNALWYAITHNRHNMVRTWVDACARDTRWRQSLSSAWIIITEEKYEDSEGKALSVFLDIIASSATIPVVFSRNLFILRLLCSSGIITKEDKDRDGVLNMALMSARRIYELGQWNERLATSKRAPKDRLTEMFQYLVIADIGQGMVGTEFMDSIPYSVRTIYNCYNPFQSAQAPAEYESDEDEDSGEDDSEYKFSI